MVEGDSQQEQSNKAMVSLAMFISWEIWKGRNARVFWNNASALSMLVAKLKEEVALWSHLGLRP
jgi:hypothetical protein